jgi:hypothetical protein
MNGMRKGLLLAAIQIAIVLSLGGKLLYDRATRPRVWVLCQVYDPDLPIRGRYLSEQIRMPAEGFAYVQPKANQSEWWMNPQWAYFEVRDGRLIAVPQGHGSAGWVSLHQKADGTLEAISREPVLLFIPDRADIPSLKPGEEMWVEVTIPAQGAPRPIRMAIKKDGAFTPIKTS